MTALSAALATFLVLPAAVFAAETTQRSPHGSLHETIAALDTAVFDAFNQCSDAAQLEKHASYFASNVEFYHDTGGVTWNRNQMLANTRKYVCGNFTRELITGTLEVYPIKDFGAISQGSHRFCQISSGKCEGMADFVMIWSHASGKWEITRVISFGHRPAGSGP